MTRKKSTGMETAIFNINTALDHANRKERIQVVQHFGRFSLEYKESAGTVTARMIAGDLSERDIRMLLNGMITFHNLTHKEPGEPARSLPEPQGRQLP